jgi:ABC-type molybdate transport system substrate-binding protein
MATSENAPNWAKDFLQELSSGVINSTTKAKDQATILWREKSSSHDSKRAVQGPSQQPTGQAVKRKRQDDEKEDQDRA